MFALDPDGRIIYWNAGAARTLGYGEEEVLGHSMALIFTEEDRNAGIVEHELKVAASQGRSEDERWHVRKDGARFWATGIVIPVRDSGGTLVGFGKILRDHTDQKELQETLRNRASELARSDEDKNLFLATLAHELRTPLGVLMNSAELLKKAAVNPARIAEMIERQVRHTRSLVDDLMDIVRVGRNKLQLHRSPLDLRDVIIQAADMVQPLANSRGVEFKVAQADCELRISGDFNRVLQVFVNLLNNAIKFTEAGGQVNVAATCEGSEAVARIVDTGVGIPPDQLSSIFELFSQAHTALPGSQLGVGIGLALTRDLVALHNGTIQARSQGLGTGSEFIVRLPLLSGQQEVTPVGSDGGVNHEKHIDQNR